ncbi:MAG: DNA-packaging protein [Dehalococcoidia bacterium]|jgi:hypothetical protein|nr:DNA-packaging protein [Dehalococcoidia bacterium]
MPKTKANFTTADELRGCVEGYFAMCDAHTTKAHVGKGLVMEVPDPLPYTFTRLAVVCGTGPETLKAIMLRGEKDPGGPDAEKADIIFQARLRIEANLEERMLRGLGYGQGHIFALKNHYGWRDTVEHTGADGGPILIRFDKQDEKL